MISIRIDVYKIMHVVTIRVARCIPERIWHILTNNEEYRTQSHALTQRNLKKLEDIVNAS